MAYSVISHGSMASFRSSRDCCAQLFLSSSRVPTCSANLCAQRHPRRRIAAEQRERTYRCPVVVNSDERSRSFPCRPGEKRFVNTPRVERYSARRRMSSSFPTTGHIPFPSSGRKLFYRYISFLPEINFARARRKNTFNFFERDYALFHRSLSILVFHFRPPFGLFSLHFLAF